MSIRHLFFAASLGLALPAGAQQSAAQPLSPGLIPATTSAPTTLTFSLTQTLQAARNNLDVSLARRALASAQGDIAAADHAPAPVLSTKAASIDLQNGIGGGNLIRQKRIDKAIGVDWTWERGNKR